MWALYCLPGRAITHFGFLFPKRGEYGASRRRDESGCLVFVYSTIVWAVLGWLAWGYATGVSPTKQLGQATSSLSFPEALNNTATSNEAGGVSLAEVPTEQSVRETVQSRPARLTNSAREVPDADIVRIASAPRDILKIEAAIELAIADSKAKRWKALHHKGWVTPSEPSENGCRQVRVTIDKAPDATIDLITMCPTTQVDQ